MAKRARRRRAVFEETKARERTSRAGSNRRFFISGIHFFNSEERQFAKTRGNIIFADETGVAEFQSFRRDNANAESTSFDGSSARLRIFTFCFFGAARFAAQRFFKVASRRLFGTAFQKNADFRLSLRIRV